MGALMATAAPVSEDVQHPAGVVYYHRASSHSSQGKGSRCPRKCGLGSSAFVRGQDPGSRTASSQIRPAGTPKVEGHLRPRTIICNVHVSTLFYELDLLF